MSGNPIASQPGEQPGPTDARISILERKVAEQKKLVEAKTVTDDYRFDTAHILRLMGIDPQTVKPGTVRLSFPNGVCIIEYQVIRGVPTKILAGAFVSGIAQPDVSRETSSEDPHEDWVDEESEGEEPGG